MTYPDFIHIGSITKAFGYKGELVIYFENENFDDDEVDALFIEIDKKLIPFNIVERKYRHSSSSVAIKFAEVNSESMALALVGNKIFLPENLIEGEDEMEIFRQRILSFHVIDEAHGNIGEVVDLIEYPGHEILSIKKGRKEILIPLNEEFILKIDDQKKIIYLQTPEGLIDLYL